MWPNLQFPEDLVTFTEEILNGKLHFLCSANYAIFPNNFCALLTHTSSPVKTKPTKSQKLSKLSHHEAQNHKTKLFSIFFSFPFQHQKIIKNRLLQHFYSITKLLKLFFNETKLKMAKIPKNSWSGDKETDHFGLSNIIIFLRL